MKTILLIKKTGNEYSHELVPDLKEITNALCDLSCSNQVFKEAIKVAFHLCNYN